MYISNIYIYIIYSLYILYNILYSLYILCNIYTIYLVKKPNIQQTIGYREGPKLYLEEGVDLPPVSKDRIKTIRLVDQ